MTDLDETIRKLESIHDEMMEAEAKARQSIAILLVLLAVQAMLLTWVYW